MKEVGLPITVSYLDKRMSFCYMTVRSMLAEMVKTGDVKRLKTLGSSLFVLPDYQLEFEE